MIDRVSVQLRNKWILKVQQIEHLQTLSLSSRRKRHNHDAQSSRLKNFWSTQGSLNTFHSKDLCICRLPYFRFFMFFSIWGSADRVGPFTSAPCLCYNACSVPAVRRRGGGFSEFVFSSSPSKPSFKGFLLSSEGSAVDTHQYWFPQPPAGSAFGFPSHLLHGSPRFPN